MYKIHISDRNYQTWVVYDSTSLSVIDNLSPENFNPSDHKLFTNDVFSLDPSCQIVHSSVRLTDNIPAVLVLDGSKTYGRDKKTGKLLYKCVPDDVRLPSFLVPYELKNVGFSKVHVNRYVTIKYVEWTSKHPIGVLTNSIGDINVLDNFYEYQLYCKSLNASIQKFTKDTADALKNVAHDAFIEKICEKNPSIENRIDWNIFTIDPKGSQDFDDGFSIKELADSPTSYLLSIYIANVTIWLDNLNLWTSFSRRISTIYLPDRKRPMLPTILSDCLCSLQEGRNRIAFVMDIVIKEGQIVSTKYGNCVIKVSRNYVYEDPILTTMEDYKKALNVAKELSRTYKYLNNVRNSHELVCYLMILMNYNCAKELLDRKQGVFRSTILRQMTELPESLPENVAKFVKIWNSSAGQYINIEAVNEPIRHDMLEMDAYIHITSPIRRLVDLLNIIKFQQCVGLIELSGSAYAFYDKWIADLEYINVTMRAIRKIQSDCNLLDMCFNDSSVLQETYDGYCFDKIERNDGLFQYIVYLPQLKMATRITLRDNLENYQSRKYKLFIFHDEEKFKRKIRLQLLSDDSV